MRRACLLAALPLLAAVPDSAHADAGVRVDVSHLVAELDGAELSSRVERRLVQEGYAISSGSPDDIMVAVSGDRRAVAVEVRGGRTVLRRDLAFDGEPVAEIHLEVSHKVVALVRALLAAPAAQAAEPHLSRVLDVDVAEVPPRPVAPAAPIPSAARYAVGLGVALVRQADDVAPAGSLTARAVLASAVRAVAVATFAPSSADRVEVVDWEVLGGPALVLWQRARDSIEAAVLAGILVHRYENRLDVDNVERGDELDAVFAGRLAYHRMLHRDFAFELRTGAGATRTTREHMRNGVVVWHDERLRFELATSLLYTW